MQQKIITSKTMCIHPISYGHADEISSAGALWWTAIGLAVFWAVVGFFAQPLVSWLITWWLA